jgi:DNA-binding Xre family transcriptional regulator
MEHSQIKVETMIKVVIRAHMERKHGPENEWPSKLQIAKDVGIEPNTVYAWLDERVARVDLDVLDKWCKYLKVETGQILVREESK